MRWEGCCEPRSRTAFLGFHPPLRCSLPWEVLQGAAWVDLAEREQGCPNYRLCRNKEDGWGGSPNPGLNSGRWLPPGRPPTQASEPAEHPGWLKQHPGVTAGHQRRHPRQDGPYALAHGKGKKAALHAIAFLWGARQVPRSLCVTPAGSPSPRSAGNGGLILTALSASLPPS